MKQADSKYHLLYLAIRDMDNYTEQEDRKEILEIIKELYNEYAELKSDIHSQGKFGILYTTIEEDSRYHDHHEVFFETEMMRDNVFNDWEKDCYYDNVFDQWLQYPTPSPNFGNAEKIVKVGGLIYVEKK